MIFAVRGGFYLKDFWLCFLPLFIAMDPVGLLPMFMGLTHGLEAKDIRRAIKHSMLTATVVIILFVAIGKWIFELIGVSVADLLIAGGILLFVLSLNDLIAVEKKQRRVDPASLGAVPLGVPLMIGPAVLTTTIILENEYGGAMALSAVIGNILLTGAVFSCSRPITKIIGKTGTITVSKITSLMLAAIAVMMIRKGLMILL